MEAGKQACTLTAAASAGREAELIVKQEEEEVQRNEHNYGLSQEERLLTTFLHGRAQALLLL